MVFKSNATANVFPDNTATWRFGDRRVNSGALKLVVIANIVSDFDSNNKLKKYYAKMQQN